MPSPTPQTLVTRLIRQAPDPLQAAQLLIQFADLTREPRAIAFAYKAACRVGLEANAKLCLEQKNPGNDAGSH